jgi:hypothetical protein
MKTAVTLNISVEEVLEMNCENPSNGIIHEKEQEMKAASSRLTDEKISDESGTEATADQALAPAGLKNPFWN